MTDLVLKGKLDCSARARGSAVQSRARGAARRRLWGNGHGRFRTRGSHGIATVRGTHWLTEDRCDGTLVRVRRGVVEVRDLAKRRTVMVRAGESYLAKRR
jgi:ferric-dicitrate binding protein FerR (iron transport regulator)